MTMKLFNTSSVQDIADAIRARNGLSSTYKIAEMASAVSAIATDGTATADKILSGYTAYGLNGQKMVGTASDSGGTAIVITDEPDEHGGTIRYINGVSLDGDTVSAGTMFSGVTAHNSLGSSIVGTYVPPTIGAGHGRGQNIKTTIFPLYGADAMSTFLVERTQLESVNIVPSESPQVITPPSDTLVYEIITSNTSSTSGKYTKSFTFPTSFHEWYRLKGEVYRQGFVNPLLVIDFTFPMPYYYNNGAWYTYAGEQVDSSAEVARAIQHNGVMEITLTLSSLTLDIMGNYDITIHPTGLYEPSNYDGYNHIDVEPISSTYVGSGIPSMSSSNLAFATGTGVFTAPSGYYSTNATYTLTPKTSTNITFNSGTGVFTVSSGYYSSSPTLTLSTKAGTTITPTESEQIAVSSYYFTKGSIKVAGISSDYVGTNVSRMSSANLTFATGTGVFTAPKGYYSANATYTLTPKTATNIAFNSGTGVFTVSSGYYSSNPTLALSTRAGATITPISTGSQIAVSKGYFATGSVYVGAIPNTYVQPTGTLNITSNGTFDVKSYASASVSIAGGEYYEIYRSLANHSVITTSINSISAFLDTFLGKISDYGFTGIYFSGSFSFNNATSIGRYAFAFPYVNGYSPQQFSATFNFPSVTSITDAAFARHTVRFSIDLPLCTSISGSAFLGASITSISAPLLSSVSMYTFQYCGCLTTIDLPEATHVGVYAFNYCSQLTNVSLSKCTSINDWAFAQCSSLTTIDIRKCITVRASAFAGCNILSSISLPSCTTIGSYAFNSCSALSYIDLPACTMISNYAFAGCTSLSSINASVCTSIGNSVFLRCFSLTYISLPVCETIGQGAFESCSALQSIDLPSATSFASGAFSRCYALNTVILRGDIQSIGQYLFRSCYNLLSLYLLGGVMAPFGYYMFASTPISSYTTSTGGIYGSIYVPESLYNTYVADKSWKTYSARFVSLTNAQIALI